jgi:hypothetical protein
MYGMETAPETEPDLGYASPPIVTGYIAVAIMRIMPLAAVAGFAFVVLHFIVKYG